jgi:tetratricopeptide (TPR) repeat protein
VLSLLLSGPGAAEPAFAADWRQWERYIENGQRALDQGREAGAENWFLDAAREAERLDPKGPQLARSLRALADLYRKQGRHREAEALTQRLTTITRPGGLGASSPDVIAALESYAALLREGGRERDAAVVLRRAGRLREVSAGVSRGELLFFNPVAELRSYARLLRQRDRHAEAQSMEMLAAVEARKLIDRYETLRKGFAAESAQPSLTWMTQMAAAWEALNGRLYPEAEGLLVDAVRNAETFGPGDVRLAYSLSVLALAERAQGKSEEFARAAQRAIALLEKASSAHSLTRRGLTVLALTQLRFDFEPAQALTNLERALRMLERDLVRDHPVIGLHLAGLAASHLKLSRPERAKPYLERALAIAAQQYLPDHVPLALGLMTVVDVYVERGDYPRADAINQQVITILGKMLDPDHPDVVTAVEASRVIRQKMKSPTEVVSLVGATTVPLQISGSAMLVYATVNRSQRALLLVDTGATTTAIRPMLLTRLGKTVPDDAPRRRMVIVTGQTVDVPFVTVTIQIGDATIEHFEVSVIEALPGAPDIDGLLGGDFLQRFRVVLERAARRMTLEPLPR